MRYYYISDINFTNFFKMIFLSLIFVDQIFETITFYVIHQYFNCLFVYISFSYFLDVLSKVFHKLPLAACFLRITDQQ